MPLQNRVLPTGEIVVDPARGTLTGNRGIIHTDDRKLGTARWSHHAWICCKLDWQGRKRQVMTGRKWTELFFLDEAVAFAAGHRPCGYCRRADYNRFVDAWAIDAETRPKAPEMDSVLHASRVTPQRTHVQHCAILGDLPNGAMILLNGTPHLVWEHAVYPFSLNGYKPPVDKNTDLQVMVLTPAPIVKVLASGYAPLVHTSVGL